MRLIKTTLRHTVNTLAFTLLLTAAATAQTPEFSRTSSAGIQVTTNSDAFNDALFGIDNQFDPMGNTVLSSGCLLYTSPSPRD